MMPKYFWCIKNPDGKLTYILEQSLQRAWERCIMWIDRAEEPERWERARQMMRNIGHKAVRVEIREVIEKKVV